MKISSNITSIGFCTWSLVPVSLSEKLLPKVGERSGVLRSSIGSALLVSNTFPGILRPLSKLDQKQRYKNKLIKYSKKK